MEKPLSASKHGAQEDFKIAAYVGVSWVARHETTFTTDDVWDYLEGFSVAKAPEPRVIGSIMRQAAKDGLITKTHYQCKSKRVRINHGRAISVWRSNVYGVDLNVLG
jgi:hypothetical protein